MLTKSILMCTLATMLQMPEPTQQNFDHWKEYLRPKESELSFEGSSWKPTFWEAVVESRKTAKPIVLWAMNGHPLACT
jgi:hypothetical protein